MSIRWKLLLGACFGALIVILVTSIAIGWISYQRASESIRDLASKQLTATGSLTTESIERYFSFIDNQVSTFANNRMIIDAMSQFPAAFNAFRFENQEATMTEMASAVRHYYSEEFGTKYRDENSNTQFDPLTLAQNLDTTAIAMQYHWIANNSFPLGAKDTLDQLDDRSSYSALHALYHPHIRVFQQAFNYYDVFLVDIDSSRIVYSVYKELDFSTSLIDGPYRNSGIAEAFMAVRDSGGVGSTYLTTFSSYTPSYEAPAAFISSPIFDGEEKIGVLIFQMPIDVINNIMTHNSSWQEKGLGLTGETYLVSQEGLMQSVSRFLFEDKPAYLEALTQAGVDPSVITNIDQKNTSIGFQPVQTEAVDLAFAGEQGVIEVIDYRGEPVLSSYHLVRAGDIQFALLSEIDVAEAFSALPSLRQQIINSASIVSIFVLLFSAIAALTYASLIGRQLNKAVNIADRVADGERYEIGHISGSDEIAKVLRALDRMQNELIAKFEQQHLFTNRIKVALDNSSANVLMLDNEVNIIYINKAMLAAMTQATEARRFKCLGHKNAD